MLVSLSSLSTIAGNNMARQIRKKSGTGIYHVMLRGINRQDIFEDDEDYLYRGDRPHDTVLSRVSQTDLMELINTPLEDDGQILDIDTDGCKSISDRMITEPSPDLIGKNILLTLGRYDDEKELFMPFIDQ